jgi:L-amino acid N-acyltransferase YncA
MRFEGFPLHHTLKDGREVTIRLTETSDGPALLEFFRSLPEQDRLYLKDDVTKKEFIERFLSGIDYETMASMVVEQKGKIVAEATLYRTRYGWMAHVGEIRVIVGRLYQHKGLGTELARQLVRMALALGLDKMLVQIPTTQPSARRAFEKLGFHQEAVLIKHVKDIRGRHHDLTIMCNDVSELWESLENMTAEMPPHMDSME